MTGQCGDPECPDEHGDEADDHEDMALFDASLHYRNGQR